MAKEIIGSFVLRNEGDGCLTSKYHHYNDIAAPECFVECCKKESEIKNGEESIEPLNYTNWQGIYRTAWLEETRLQTPEFKLYIIRRTETFDLNWINGDATMFVGTAMEFDGKLVGAYWDV